MSHQKDHGWTRTGLRLLSAGLVAAQLMACTGSSTSDGSPSEAAASPGAEDRDTTEAGGSRESPNAACDCIAERGARILDEAGLKRLRDEGIPACFNLDNPAMLGEEASCLPRMVGKHAASGLDVEVYSYCSDVCPDYVRVGIRFAGITNVAACCAVRGIPLRDPAWGGFEGCIPVEIDPDVPWSADCAE